MELPEEGHAAIAELESVQFTYEGGSGPSTVDILFPAQAETIAGATQCIMREHALPCYVETSLHASLTAFANTRAQRLAEMEVTPLLEVSAAPLAKRNANVWTELFQREHVGYAVAEKTSERANFAEIYHGLVHSAASMTLLQLERTYAMNVSDLIKQRDRAVKQSQQNQMQAMDRIMAQLGVTVTDRHVNDIAADFTEKLQMLETNYDTEIKKLKSLQRQEFHDYVHSLHRENAAEELQISERRQRFGDGDDEFTNPGNTGRSKLAHSTSGSSASAVWSGMSKAVSRVNPLKNRLRASQAPGLDAHGSLSPGLTASSMSHDLPRVLSESFTVHLGTQKKTVHNLRLVCCNYLDLITAPPAEQEDEMHAHRLMTALSLYSHNISGILLLVDNRLSSYGGIKQDFARLCELSTDFHFPPLDDQLKQLELGLGDAENGLEAGLCTGDFYVTRHSNLAEAHAAFHLVIDGDASKADLNTRSPVIVGLRNVLRCAFQNGVCTMLVPLLMCHEFTEDMSSKWCLRRAELILKCVKGYIMENSAWGESESRTIHFAVPKDISEELFEGISALLSSIFRVSTALRLRD